MIRILRKADRLEASDYHQSEPELAHLNPQFILALTDTWKLNGQPVDWGLEPIMSQLRSMDRWSDSEQFNQMIKRREENEADQSRQKRNELRALAADSRRDFAKATNEINTAGLTGRTLKGK